MIPTTSKTPELTELTVDRNAAGRVTYSIVARDPETGQAGVAVQSHFFGVRAVVPWVESGIGAIATQAMAEISYGPLGLERLRNGESAADVLAALVAGDDAVRHAPSRRRRCRGRSSRCTLATAASPPPDIARATAGPCRPT